MTFFRLLVVAFILSGVFVGEDPPKPESKPLPNDTKIQVLEAKSALDDAQAARKDLDAQIANLNNQVKERYATVQKDEADAQKRYDAAVTDALKTSGLKQEDWQLDTKTWLFTKKVVQKASSTPAPPTPAK